MIPILYDRDVGLKYDDNGIGFLPDTIKAVVTEERNGTYELSMQYPVSGKRYDQIGDGCLVKVKANHTSVPQLFRIYKSSKPLKGIVTYSAQHISYDLGGFPLAGFTAQNVTAAQAIQKALTETPFSSYFSTQTDIATLNSTTIEGACTVRGLLGGMRGSILDVWGGEYEFNNRTIILHSARGADNGVTIEYGKNMTALQQESQIADTYSHIMPYASYTESEGGDPVYVFLPEKVLSNGINGVFAHGVNRALIMDFSDKFGEGVVPTISRLRTLANQWVSLYGLNYLSPKINIKVSFLPLAQTEEYKNIAPLETVSLCDTVTVRYPALGVNAKTKVIKTVYNALTEKYESITLGDMKESFAALMSTQISAVAQMRQSIDRPVFFITDP